VSNDAFSASIAWRCRTQSMWYASQDRNSPEIVVAAMSVLTPNWNQRRVCLGGELSIGAVYRKSLRFDITESHCFAMTTNGFSILWLIPEGKIKNLETIFKKVWGVVPSTAHL
jgi:hypothetical protein